MQILFYLKNNINFYNIFSYLEKVYRVSNIEIHFFYILSHWEIFDIYTWFWCWFCIHQILFMTRNNVGYTWFDGYFWAKYVLIKPHLEEFFMHNKCIMFSLTVHITPISHERNEKKMKYIWIYFLKLLFYYKFFII